MATLSNDGNAVVAIHRSKPKSLKASQVREDQLTANGAFVAVMLRRFGRIPWSSCREYMEPAQNDHDGKHPPQNPSLFEKCEHGKFSPPQSPPVTLTALDQTIYHIVYRSSIDLRWSQLSNSLIRLMGGPDLSMYENQTCREARLRRGISPSENLEFGKRWFVIGAKNGPPQRVVSGGLKTHVALISAT
jgi:hypothetical protein